MKKYFLLGLIVAIAPSICFGGGARYTQLVREKQRKMEELEKCMGSTQGLKIAGLSTIGLTAVGVAGNIAEAQKLQEYDDAIDKKNKDIETKQKAIVAEQEKIKKIEAEKKAEEEAARKKAEEQAAKEAKKDKDKVEVVDIVSQQPTVDGQILTGVVSGDNNFIWNPVNINDTGSASGSTSSINNNNDLATNKSGTPASGQGKTTTGLTNVQTYPAVTFLNSDVTPKKMEQKTNSNIGIKVNEHCDSLKIYGNFKTVTPLSNGKCQVVCKTGDYLDVQNKKCKSKNGVVGGPLLQTSGVL